VDHIPKVVSGRVGALLEDKLERDNFDYTVDALGKTKRNMREKKWP
jgi:translation initiation factor RLI1